MLKLEMLQPSKCKNYQRLNAAVCLCIDSFYELSCSIWWVNYSFNKILMQSF